MSYEPDRKIRESSLKSFWTHCDRSGSILNTIMPSFRYRNRRIDSDRLANTCASQNSQFRKYGKTLLCTKCYNIDPRLSSGYISGEEQYLSNARACHNSSQGQRSTQHGRRWYTQLPTIAEHTKLCINVMWASTLSKNPRQAVGWTGEPDYVHLKLSRTIVFNVCNRWIRDITILLKINLWRILNSPTWFSSHWYNRT